MNKMKRKVSTLFCLVFFTLSTLQLAAVTHYQTVNSYIPENKKISRTSIQTSVEAACRLAEADFTDKLERAKPRSPAKRSLLEKEKELKRICAILLDSKKRADYHKQLDKQSLDKAVKEVSELKRIQTGASHYETVNNGLKLAKLPITIKRESSQAEVNSACNKLKNDIIGKLKIAKAGSEDRNVLLANQNVISGVCTVLEKNVSRGAYHDQLDKKSAASSKSAAEQAAKDAEKAEKIRLAEEVVKEKEASLAQVKAIQMTDVKQKEDAIVRAQAELDHAKQVVEDIKAGREPKKFDEKDPNFIDKTRNFLTAEFNRQKVGADVKIFNLIAPFLPKIKIPNQAFTLFKTDFAMKDMQIITAPSGQNIRAALGFTGITQINKFPVRATIYIAQMTDKKIQYSLGIELPESYKLSFLFPKFKKLDVLDLPQGKLIASTFKYTDRDGYTVENGFNFIANMKLDGPLKALGMLRKKASQYDFIVVDAAAPIYLQGVIYSDTAVSFKSVIPMRLGIDFTKVKQIPSGFSKIINKITTDDFIVGVVIKPLEFTFNAQSGLQIVLGTQKTPLRIQALGAVDVLSGKVNIAGKIPDMLEMGFMAIGDVKIECYWDPAIESVLALFGVPVSGIALGGRIDLGKPGDTRASLMANGKLSLETKKLADFVMEVEGKNIQFAEIISLLTRMAEKSGIKGATIPASKLPVMTIHRIYGKAAPWDTEIAGTKISAGFQLALDLQLFDRKFGLDVDIKHKDLRFSGSGYMSEIAIKKGNKTIFKLSGPGPDKQYNTPDDGPIVSCMFDAKKPLEGSFRLATMLDIPAIGLKTAIDLQIANKAFKAEFEFGYAGFTTLFGASIDTKDLMSMAVRFGFKGDFEEFLSKQAKPALESLKREANVKMAAVDKKIGELAGELEKLRKKQTKAKSEGVGATQREINKTRATIKTIHAKIAALKKECADAPLVKKTYICPKVGAEITAQGSALVSQETYLNTLLKPGKKVIAGTMDALNTINAATQKASKAISDAEVFRKSVQVALTGLSKAVDAVGKGASIFKITEVLGEFHAKELWDGKLPSLKVLKAEVNIPGIPKVKVNLSNLQFDFKNPTKSAINIALKLIQGVQIG